jgi:hypothetical protein
MVKRLILPVMGVLLFAIASAGANGSMRCGSSFVKIGERAYLVQRDCGEPVTKQLIGYTINQQERRELTIEEWIYGPRDGGYFYIITFVGGKVSRISSER